MVAAALSVSTRCGTGARGDADGDCASAGLSVETARQDAKAKALIMKDTPGRGDGNRFRSSRHDTL
jgi:hypothetical protein